MTIFRIEHPEDGFGFFNEKGVYNENSIGKFTDLKIRFETFPSPYYDNFDKNYKYSEDYGRNSLYCSFKSICDLTSWIEKNEMIALAKAGFRIYKIKVSKCYIGAYQVLYNKNDIIEKEDYTDNIIG